MAKKRQRKKTSSNGKRQENSDFLAEMRRLRDERKQEPDRERRRALAARHEQIKKEFLQWQDDLCWLVRNKSKVSVRPDGSAVYVLPTDLVRLVWQTMISQRVAAEAAKGKSHHEALAIAMDGLREDIGKLAQHARAKGESSASESGRADSTDGGSAAELGDVRQDQPAG